MSNVLLDHYQQAVDNHTIEFDNAQWQALQYLQTVYDQLIKCNRNWLSRWMFGPATGVYLYGPVGSGKTYLLDLLFQTLPIEQKKRVHFHHFMAWVHDQIAAWEHQDPLKQLAKDYAKTCQLLCFDEFYVTNIADAMVLGELLEGLYENNVTTIMSSNVVPKRLYEGGLNRERFMPAIELIESRHFVVNVDNKIDYRQTPEDESTPDERFYYPVTKSNQHNIWQAFQKVASGEVHYDCEISVNSRSIRCLAQSDDSIVFDFKTLCTVPRSQRDYLVLANRYTKWFLVNVPSIGRSDHTLICNFIKLIDILYDKGVELWVLAEVSIDNIYPAGKYHFAFKRARSRLQAMKTG